MPSADNNRECTASAWAGSARDTTGGTCQVRRKPSAPPVKATAALAGLKDTSVAPPAAPEPVKVPADLAAALEKRTKARTGFEALSPSHRREYVEWITAAKRDETRARRVATTLEWLSQGKPRNWKYMK